MGLRLLRDKNPAGARQLATTVRLYAATVDDAQLRSGLQRVGRQQIKEVWLKGDSHAEFEQAASDLGIPVSEVPHTIDMSRADAAFDRLRDEGLGRFMRESAEALDAMAVLLESKAQQATVGVVTVARRVSAAQCADCQPVCSASIQAAELAATVCAAARLFPPLAELCVAAAATWLTFSTACQICQLISCTRWGG